MKGEVGGACGSHGRQQRCMQGIGETEGKIPQGRPRHRWEVNIEMDLQGLGGEA